MEELMAAKKKAVKKTVKKTTTRKTAGRAKKTVAKAADVHIDFPREGDVLPNSGHYAVRIGAKPDTAVELSFDNKNWFQCREAAGYYWFDWYPTKVSGVTLTARIKNGNRVSKRSAPRKVCIEG